MNIIQKPVSNFDKSRHGQKPKCVVLHIADGSQKSIYQTFSSTQRSTHYAVDTDGTIWQFVDERSTAWGNGIVKNPTARIVKDNPGINPNWYSISIEHAGFGSSDINEAQYEATAELVHGICQRWDIPFDRDHIIGHREITTDKICPGKINIQRIINMSHAFQFSPPPIKPEVEITKLQTQLSLLQKLISLFTQLKQKQMLLGNIGESTSQKYSLNRVDLLKVLRTFLLSLAPAALLIITQLLTQIDFGTATPLIMAIVPPMLELLRRYLVDYSL